MKNLVILSAATIALLNLSSAAAMAAPAGASALTAREAAAPGAQEARRAAAAWQQYLGQYLLDDGATLTLSRHGRSLYAELGAQSQVEVQAAGDGALASADGSLVVEFRQHANGVIAGVKVTRVRLPG